MAMSVISLLHFNGDLRDAAPFKLPLLTCYPPLFSTEHRHSGTHSFANTSAAQNGLLVPVNLSPLFSDQPLTLECWVKAASTTYWYEYATAVVFYQGNITSSTSSTNYNLGLYIYDTGTLELSAFIGSTTRITISAAVLTQTQWAAQFHALAVTWDTSVLRLFLDGVLVGSANTTGAFYNTAAANPAFGIGAGYTNPSSYNSPRLFFKSYIDEFRFTHGEALYTANYTPSSAAFDDPTVPAPIAPSFQRLDKDVSYGGALSIIEPVTRLNTIPPQSRRVRLCDQRSGRLVREGWSDPVSGDIEFANLREGPWTLYALDHTGEYEAVAISDRLATADGARP